MMVYASPDEANDALYAVITAAVEANGTAILPAIPSIYWPNIVPEETELEHKKNEFWLLIRNEVTSTDRRTFGRPAIWETTGRLYADLYCPISKKQSADRGQRYGTVLRDAWITSSLGMILSKPTVGALSQTRAAWTIYGVSVQYNFTERK
jgi:hypothetical protein